MLDSPASSAAPHLVVRGVSKRYELHSSVKTRFLHQLLGPFSPVKPSLFPAVEDVSFELKPGEAIAILGRNGAGKSTLLQIVSGVLQPTTGTVELPGRVIGLLELGSGFNPNFTGRENIWINGAILGLTRAEIKYRLDEIVTFAEIGEFIDQPVRTYSSGMFLRLAFGIATAASPDLLLIDEVLAVGDIFFRQKCYERLRAMRASGTAIVLVTHSLMDAAEFCDVGCVLSEGRLAFHGKSVDAVNYFMQHEREARTGTRAAPRAVYTSSDAGAGVSAEVPEWLESPAAIDVTELPQVGDDKVAVIKRLLITDREDNPTRIFHQGEWVRIRALFQLGRHVERAIIGLGIRNETNLLVHGKNGINVEDDCSPANVGAGTRLEFVYDLKLDLDYGEYTIELAIAEVDEAVFARRRELLPDDVAPAIRRIRSVSGAGAISVILERKGRFSTFSHYGVAELPSSMQTRAVRLD